MKAIARTIRSPQKYIYKQFYSTDRKAGKMLELSDIPTEQEIEHDVIRHFLSSLRLDYDRRHLKLWCEQSPKMMKLEDFLFFCLFVGRRSANQIAVGWWHLGWQVVGLEESKAHCVHAWVAGNYSCDTLERSSL